VQAIDTATDGDGPTEFYTRSLSLSDIFFRNLPFAKFDRCRDSRAWLVCDPTGWVCWSGRSIEENFDRRQISRDPIFPPVFGGALSREGPYAAE
jgi:hypothetical protein